LGEFTTFKKYFKYYYPLGKKIYSNLSAYVIQLFLLYSILSSVGLKSQEPYYYSLNEENGLPSSEVYQIKQDNFGFVWIGCEAGLYRYDGVRFKNFIYKGANSRGVADIKVDNKNRVWCQNFTGQIFYLEKDTLRLFKDFSFSTRVFPHYSLTEDLSVWVATEKYIEKFNVNGSSECKAYHRRGEDTTIWYDIETTYNNEILATSYNLGLCKVDYKHGKINIVPIKGCKTTGGRINIESQQNSVYILEEVVSGLKYDLLVYNNNRLKFLTSIENLGFVYKVIEDKNGEIWLCTSKGIVSYSVSKGVYKKSIFQNDKISSFYEDKEGSIWLTSLQNGIHIIPRMSFYINERFYSILRDNYISSILIDKNNEVIVGTYSGSVYKIKDSVIKEVFIKSKGNYGLVKKVMKHGDNYFVSRIKFSYYENGSEYSCENLRNLRDFCVLRDTVYYATSHATGYFPLRSIKKDEKVFLTNLHIIQSRGAKSIVCDTVSGTVFFSSNEGLFKYHLGVLQEIKFNNQKVYAVKLIFQNNSLWIATVSDGLYQYNKGITDKPRLINEHIRGNQIKTFKIQNGKFWVATEMGLNKIDLEGKVIYFDLSDGLNTRQINDIGFIGAKVYLATNKGIISFESEIQEENKYKPKILINQLKLNNQLIASSELNKIKYNDRLSINFVGPCFKARGDFNYKYRLLGLDSNWVIVDALNNEVIYQSLPSGNFKFEVKAINEDGFESEEAACINFSVGKPFWQTIWFYLVIAVLGALMVFLVSILIIRNIRKKNRIKNELIHSQLTAIRSQMNPHFLYNTLNSIQDLILKADIKNTNYYLSKFSSLMRNILEFSEEERIIMFDEIEMLQNYLELERLRFGDEFKFKIEVDASINIYNDFVPSLVVQPFVENAIKHGLLHKKGEKKLSIEFKRTNGVIVITIEDNGVGRKRSEEINNRSQIKHKSFASKAVQKRLSLLNNRNKDSQISVEVVDLVHGEEAVGTKVILTITTI